MAGCGLAVIFTHPPGSTQGRERTEKQQAFFGKAF